MKVKDFSKASGFLSQVGDLLAKDEARYGLIYGIVNKLVDNPYTYGSTSPWFCTLSDITEVYAIAMRTPPYKVILAHFTGDPSHAAKLLADHISHFSRDISDVVGDREITKHFMTYWCNDQGVTVVDRQLQRIYRLVKLNRIKFAKGRFRLASEADEGLVLKWTRLFHDEVFSSANRSEPIDDGIDRIGKKEVYLWEDNVPVSMAAKSRPTNKGMSVNYVYTPPEFRRKGYATSCVAMTCKDILDSGYEFCTLYTDLANATSNSIYKRIGFKEVCDSIMYTFSLPTEVE